LAKPNYHGGGRQKELAKKKKKEEKRLRKMAECPAEAQPGADAPAAQPPVEGGTL